MRMHDAGKPVSCMNDDRFHEDIMNIENTQMMSSAELYALAREKEREEALRNKEANKEQIKALRAERRSMLKSHQAALLRLQEAQAAELATLDARIAELGGRVPAQSPLAGSDNRPRQSGRADMIIQVLGQAPQMSLDELRQNLEASGVTDTKTLSQTMAYLKKQGRVEQVSRGVYQLAA